MKKLSKEMEKQVKLSVIVRNHCDKKGINCDKCNKRIKDLCDCIGTIPCFESVVNVALKLPRIK